MSLLTIHIDGAARGNPGPAAYAYVIYRDGQPPLEESGRLGHTTNNVAEYTALVHALQRAAQLGAQRLLIRSDSELLVKQMNGEYQVKNEQLRGLFTRAKQLCRGFDLVTLQHVRRADNSEADRLCNEALDGKPAARSSSAAKPARTRKRPVVASASVREEAVACLQAAAAAWAAGGPGAPTPDMVWEQLWSILEENNVLRRRTS